MSQPIRRLTGGPALLQSRARSKPVIGVDLGGTKISAGLVDASGVVRRQRVTPTPAASATHVIAAIEALVADVAGDTRIEAVGVGAPGVVYKDQSTVSYAPNLPLTGVPLGVQLSQRLGVPVVVENDANAAAWAESRFGAAQEAQNAVVLTIGTGIGGGIILGGELVRGSTGAAAEVGHLLLSDNGPRCGCGTVGCFEALASGTALVREAQTRAYSSAADAACLLALVGGAADAIEGRHVTLAADKGDGVARAAFDSVGYWLGRGVASLVALLDVEVVVVGGGVSEAGDLILRPLTQGLRTLIVGGSVRPVPAVVLARLGTNAGLIGAADLARRTV